MPAGPVLSARLSGVTAAGTTASPAGPVRSARLSGVTPPAKAAGASARADATTATAVVMRVERYIMTLLCRRSSNDRFGEIFQIERPEIVTARMTDAVTVTPAPEILARCRSASTCSERPTSRWTASRSASTHERPWRSSRTSRSVRGPQSRDALVDLLWPDADPDRGRAALRRTLSTLRSALGGRWVEVSRAAVALEVEPDAVDLHRFRRLARQAGDGAGAIQPLSVAVELHRGDLLAGFGLRDSVRFDDWQRDAAAELRAELERALDRLAAALEAAARPADAVPHARRRLALDPLHEPAHRSLIRLYAASGHRAEALTQYRECVRVLDRELGVRPLPETTELYNAVNEGQILVAEAPAAAPAVAAVQVAARPLVGRDREWRVLLAEYEACGADGRLVVLEGEPGVGKTRLGEELLAAARDRGHLVVAVRSYEGEAGIAFGLVAAAIRSALAVAGAEPLAGISEHSRAEAARLVPELGDVGAASPDSLAAQHRLHDGLANVLAALVASDPPGVLFLDDLQLADPASLAMVAYLVHRLAGRPMLVVAAWRSEEIGSEQATLRRSAHRVIRLGRLGRADVAELAEAAGVGEHAQRLFDETEGLPLFVVEYLAALGRIPRTMPSRWVCARSSPRGWTRPARPPRSSSPPPPSSGDRSTSTRSARRPDAARRRRRPGSTSSPGAAFWSSEAAATSSPTRSCSRSCTSRRAWRDAACCTGVSRRRSRPATAPPR